MVERIRSRQLAMLWVCIFFLGSLACSPSSSSPLRSNPDDARAARRQPPLLITEKEEYVVAVEVWTFDVTIDFTFTNATKDMVYISRCGGPRMPSLEKLSGQDWVAAYHPFHFSCLEPPLRIEPEESIDLRFRVVAGRPGTSLRPKFLVTEISGTYRLVWPFLFKTLHANGRTSDPLPLELRVSNRFTLSMQSDQSN